MAAYIQEFERFRSSLVAICDYCCRARHSGPSEEEYSEEPGITFLRSGAFAWHVRGQDVLANTNQVLFFPKHVPYRVSHPVEGGDDCTVFRFAPSLLAEAFGRVTPAIRDTPDAPFQQTHGVCGTNTFMLHHGVRQMALSPDHDALTLEESAMRLLEAVVKDTSMGRCAGGRGVRRSTRWAHRDTAYATQLLLQRTFHDSLTLGEIAARVHSSPYHLTRLFAAETGVSLHRYRMRLRVREAIERLTASGPDLTQLALDLGFSSHSHFTTVFRREVGITPSQFRRGLIRSGVRKMSKNLKVRPLLSGYAYSE